MRSVTLDDGNIINLHDEGEVVSDLIVSKQDYYEREILDYIEENYKSQTGIIDVGANIGNHTLFFGTHLTYDYIVAFEPIPQNFNLLNANTDNIKNLMLRREAVGDGRIEVMMQINHENMGACEVTPAGDIKVSQVRLDDLFVSNVSLIKIDAEWYEPFVLLGAKDLIEEDRPLVLIEDANDEYSDLLPSYYYLIKAWPDHKTYLYGADDGS